MWHEINFHAVKNVTCDTGKKKSYKNICGEQRLTTEQEHRNNLIQNILFCNFFIFTAHFPYSEIIIKRYNDGCYISILYKFI